MAMSGFDKLILLTTVLALVIKSVIGSCRTIENGGQLGSGRAFAGKDGTTGGRTHGSRGIGIEKAFSFRGQLIDIWRLIITTSGTTDILPSHIVNQYKQDIWRSKISLFFHSTGLLKG